MPSPAIAATARCSYSISALLFNPRHLSPFPHRPHPVLHRISAPRKALHLQQSEAFAALLQTLPPICVLMAADAPPEGYRPNVGLCLINDLGQIFVARRVDVPDAWQMPQGGVDENEEPQSAALRELEEETGVTSAEIIDKMTEWVTYDFPPDVKQKMTRIWCREWTGQAQKWYLLRFKGDETEINLNAEGIERAEFSEWKWASADEVISKAVAFKKPVYEKVLKAFSPTLKWDSVGISSQSEIP